MQSLHDESLPAEEAGADWIRGQRVTRGLMGAASSHEVDGVAPRAVSEPVSVEALAGELAKARAAGLKVLPRGQGTRLTAGRSPHHVDLLLLTTRIDRVIQYEPADLTVTIEAGYGLEALDRMLRERKQVLPLQARRRRGTVGGLIATGPEGGVALGYGTVRDHLIGSKVAMADGTLVKGGGRVVKNVAGYGVHRLMIGSFGTLGVIVEASFKVQPRPEMEASVLFEFSSVHSAFEAARRVLDSGMEPVFANVLIESDAARLAVGFDGFEGRVKAHLKRVAEIVALEGPNGLEIASEAVQEDLRSALDDPAAMLPDFHALVRLASLPDRTEEIAVRAGSAAREVGAFVRADARPGVGSVYLLLRAAVETSWLATLGTVLSTARSIGHATVLAAPAAIHREIDPWGPPSPDLFLMKRIKQALDPTGVMAAGRFVGGI